jgi:hypothetical protein
MSDDDQLVQEINGQTLVILTRAYELMVMHKASLEREREKYKQDLEKAIEQNFQVEFWKDLIDQVERALVSVTEKLRETRLEIAELHGFDTPTRLT